MRDGLRVPREWTSCTSRGARMLVASACAAVAVGMSALPAQAITFSQHTALSNVTFPESVAVDSAGDLFVSSDAGASTNSVIELPYGGTQKTLLSGLSAYYGARVAVDATGDVFVAIPT